MFNTCEKKWWRWYQISADVSATCWRNCGLTADRNFGDSSNSVRIDIAEAEINPDEDVCERIYTSDAPVVLSVHWRAIWQSSRRRAWWLHRLIIIKSMNPRSCHATHRSTTSVLSICSFLSENRSLPGTSPRPGTWRDWRKSYDLFSVKQTSWR